MEQDFYSAAALAAALNVPRTTINDWLTRYENYIDVQQNGKRKVYSARSLKVLEEIASMRDAGKSGAEIENFLAGKHGITPEVAPEKPAAAPRSKSKTPAPEAAAENTSAPAEESSDRLPAVKEIERSAMELTSFIADLRRQQQISTRRSRAALFLLLAIIIILLGAGAVLLQAVRMQFAERQYEAMKMRENMEKLTDTFNAELKNMEKARRTEQAAAAASVKALKDELFALQKARAAEVARLEKQLANDRAAWQKLQAKREKDLQAKSAAERKLLLEKMEQDAAASKVQLDALKSELVSAGKSLAELSIQLEKLNSKPAPAPTPVTVPAAEKPVGTPEAVPAPAEKNQ